MVASVGPSYNVLSLFQKPEGSAAAADTAATDAIIETIQQMKSDTSPARLQGASAATQAWIESAPVAAASGAAVGAGGASVEAGSESNGVKEEGKSGGSGHLRGISAATQALIEDVQEQTERVREREYSALEAAGLGDKVAIGKVANSDEFSGGGGSNVQKILGDAFIFNLTHKYVRAYEAGSLHRGEVTGFNIEKDEASGDWNLSSKVPEVDGKRLEYTMNESKSLNYYWYNTVSDSINRSLLDIKEGRYDVSGDVLLKNDDGTYRAGVFSVRSLEGANSEGGDIMLEHDGSGIAKKYLSDGSYSEVDLVGFGLWG